MRPAELNPHRQLHDVDGVGATPISLLRAYRGMTKAWSRWTGQCWDHQGGAEETGRGGERDESGQRPPLTL
jgi:hypothetical protein